MNRFPVYKRSLAAESGRPFSGADRVCLIDKVRCESLSYTRCNHLEAMRQSIKIMPRI